MIKRGDIFYADINEGKGSEQNGRRPVVILQNNRANAYVLMRKRGFPTLKIGKRMVVPKDKLIAWIDCQIPA